MRRTVTGAFLILCLGASGGHAAPAPRPLTGCALVSATGDAAGEVVIYADPGVHRVAQLPLSRLPALARSESGVVLAVLARKGRWVKVAYDDAERQGWIEAPAAWGYLPWRDALPGKGARLLPAMKKGNYLLRENPGEAEDACGELTRNQPVRILAVQEDWALSEAPPGWFRWRDAEGRLTISLENGGAPEKR